MTKSEGVKTKQFCCLSNDIVSENSDDENGDLEEDVLPPSFYKKTPDVGEDVPIMYSFNLLLLHCNINLCNGESRIEIVRLPAFKVFSDRCCQEEDTSIIDFIVLCLCS